MPKFRVQAIEAQNQGPLSVDDLIKRAMMNAATLYWNGSCRTWIPEKGKDCGVLIDLKIISSSDDGSGNPMFIMTHPELFSKSHSMKNYVLDIQKNHICVIRFTSPDAGSTDARYSLKFDDVETATEFRSRAELLQRVMGYLNNMAAADKIANSESVPPAETDKTQKKLHRIESPVIASVESSANAPQLKEETEASTKTEKMSQMMTENKKAVEAESNKRSIDREDNGEDVFKKLSLDKVKGADMYKADRSPRVQYSPEELLERRSAAETPPGIENVKIPLEKYRGHCRLPPHMRDYQKNTSSSVSQPTRDIGKPVGGLAAAKKLRMKTEVGSQVSMPGLSEAVKHEKKATASAEPLSKEHSAKNRVGTQAVADAAIYTTSSENVDINIKIDNDLAKNKPVGEPSVSVSTIKSHDTVALSNASTDSAIAFDPASKTIHPLPVVIDQKSRSMENSTTARVDIKTQTGDATMMERQEVPIESTSSSAMVTEGPAQPIHATTPAIHVNPLFGNHAHGGHEMPHQMSTPQIHPPQISLPPHLLSPQMACGHQMHPQPMLAGMQHYPPAGIVHAVTVTYHISHSGPYDGPERFPGQGSPVVHQVTDFNGHHTGRVYSPTAQVFQPQVLDRVSRSNPAQPREHK
ncbi:hypothetical protein EsH8_V_000614 [Colletotrichum jinshuiense]